MREYNTEILSVGTELLLGHVTNTDARDISEMLSKIGINVRYHTVVGDNPERLRRLRGHRQRAGGHHHHHRRPGPHLRRSDQADPGRVLRPEAGGERRGGGRAL